MYKIFLSKDRGAKNLNVNTLRGRKGWVWGTIFQYELVLDPWRAEAAGWQILVLVRCACFHSRVMVPL